MVELREEARAQKDWSGSDRLREQIFDLGWQVQDTRSGPQLKPKT
jgi:cysteinyl-tRNA synthetase